MRAALGCAILLALLTLSAAHAGDDDAALVSLTSVSNGCGGGVAGEDPRFFDTLNYWGVNVSFREACNVHDACYSGAVVRNPFSRPPDQIVDFRSASQERCDDEFLANMQTLCRKRIHDSPTFAKFEQARDDCEHGHGPTLPPCTSLADLIPRLVGNYAIGAEMAHRVVRKCGHIFFRDRRNWSGKWTNRNSAGTTVRAATVRQVGRDVTVTWTGEPRFCGSGTGTLVTRDQDDELRVDAVVTGFTNGGTFRGTVRIVAKGNSLTFEGVPGSPTLYSASRRSPQSAGAKCAAAAPKPTPAATPASGSFVLTGSRVTQNPYGKEVTIGDGSATWDHCCDGGKWKIQYTWKVPGTLVPGKTFSISMSLKIVTVEPRQPLLDQISAFAPDFRQDLSAQYIGQPSASKTYAVPFSTGYKTDPNIKDVKLYISFAHASVEYTYRRVG